MDRETRLETNRSGFFEIRWVEATGRTRSVSTRTKDRALAEKVRRSFVKGEQDAALRASGGVSVGVLLDMYEAAAKGRGVTERMEYSLKPVRAFFGAMLVDELDPETVLDYQAFRARASGTVRRELVQLTAALNWASKHRKITNAPKIDLPAPGEARAVFLDTKLESELYALASRAEWPVGRLSRTGRFICIGLDTGARKAAIEGLTWDRVDLVRGVIDFRDPGVRTTKKRRVATPIPARLKPVLERAAAERKDGCVHVLDHAGNVRKGWASFMKRHGFEDVTPHVLRHTRITLLLQAGVSVWDVSALVGASPAVIQAVYGHFVADSRLSELANRRVAA